MSFYLFVRKGRELLSLSEDTATEFHRSSCVSIGCVMSLVEIKKLFDIKMQIQHISFTFILFILFFYFSISFSVKPIFASKRLAAKNETTGYILSILIP